MKMIQEFFKQKELYQMMGGQILMSISTIITSINLIVGSIAGLLGLVVIIYSILNARKKAKLLDLSIKEKEEELEN